MPSVPMWFLAESELYKSVKPYRLDFDPEDDTIPRTNIRRVKIPEVPVHDIRVVEGKLRFAECGFTLLSMPIELASIDYNDNRLVAQRYYSYIESVVGEFSESLRKGAKVLALDHKVRKRDPMFPISSGKNYSIAQPVLVAHVDWTPDTIKQKLRIVAGDDRAETILSGDYQFCHAWRPIFGPLQDFPLAVCDFATINPDEDLEPADDVTENQGIDENYLVYYRPQHKWYYMSDQEPTDILLFRQYDSRIGLRSGVPHCAIPNPVPSEKIIPRESIEVELIIWWE